MLILHTLGAHGIVFLFASVFIILGFIKLSFGRVLFCRKTKAQAMADKLKKEGIVDPKPKDGKLTKCHHNFVLYIRQVQFLLDAPDCVEVQLLLRNVIEERWLD